MKKLKAIELFSFIFVLFVVFACSNNKVETSVPPSKELTNGIVTAKLYLPDAQNGYYRSTRFDWSGIIYSLEYEGHSYIGQWFENYDPYVHESITGPVEEFGTIGYDSAKIGEGFLKIGVGILKKGDEERYHFSNPYEIINSGEWKVKSGKREIEFTHNLESKIGYSYNYTKTIEITENKPEIVIKHSLKNTGNKIIDTNVYDHNFFIIDEELAGPEITLEFNFNIEGEGRGVGELFEIQENRIVYLKDLPVIDGKRTVGSMAVTGFSSSADDYNIKIENQKTKTGVHIKGDQPITQIRFWTSTTTYCPEPFIKIYVEPNNEITWEYKYELYTF